MAQSTASQDIDIGSVVIGYASKGKQADGGQEKGSRGGGAGALGADSFLLRKQCSSGAACVPGGRVI
jgi:hypothetical protein